MSDYLQTALTDALGCRYPIVQTAMGWVSDANLVIASTRVGRSNRPTRVHSL